MSDTNKQNSCPQRPCQSRPFDRPTCSDDGNTEVRGRPILYAGVVWIGIIRKFLIPRTCDSSPPVTPARSPDTPVVESVSHITQPSSSQMTAKPNLQAALLANKRPDGEKDREQLDDKEGMEPRRRPKRDNKPSSLAVLIKQIQERSVTISDQVRQLSHDLSSLMSDGQASTTETIKTIRAEDAVIYRYGAISTSGLVGYLMGLHRGKLVRLVYCATGTTAMACICYPEAARLYNSEGLKLAKDCIVYCLSLIRESSEKVLRKENARESKWSEVIENENPEKKSPTQNNKFTANLTSLRNKFGTLGHHHDQNTRKQSSADSGEESAEGGSENSMESEEIIKPPKNPEVSDGPPPSQFSLSCERGGKLSMQCQPDITGSLNTAVPYSPALPSPPKFKPPNNQPRQNSSEQISLRESTATKPKSSLYPYSLHDPLDGSLNDECKEEESSSPKTEQSNGDLNPFFGIIPTPEPDLVTENEGDSFGNDEFNKNQDKPMNRKLNRYYEQVREKQIASEEKGYDDLYSKRQ